jgi:hypothetical protein
LPKEPGSTSPSSDVSYFNESGWDCIDDLRAAQVTLGLAAAIRVNVAVDEQLGRQLFGET